jgi:broad specificity phosphatase PhoE
MAQLTGSSRLWLVRHVQASFASPDYDVLSARGEHQAERLAAWLVAHPELHFAHVVAGTLHRRTVHAVLAASLLAWARGELGISAAH